MILKLSLLLLTVYILGILLTLVLYKFNVAALLKSELGKKILMWIPITIVFLSVAFANDTIKLLGFLLLLTGVLVEQIKIIVKKKLSPRFLFLAILPFTIAFLHLPFAANQTETLIILAVAASLSDVGAFFFGKFIGFHKLPKSINPNKAWEGVLGQVVGAFIGIVLLKTFIFPDLPILWSLPIGFGSAMGDLYNSFLKREAKIKVWSNILPGHGGLTDRFASLAFSSVLFFYAGRLG